MTPLLILLLGIHPGTAAGTDLLYAAATKTSGTTVHGLARSVEWRLVGRLALGSIPATVVTIYLLSLLGPASPQTSAIVTTVLGAVGSHRHFAAVPRQHRPRIPEKDRRTYGTANDWLHNRNRRGSRRVSVCVVGWCRRVRRYGTSLTLPPPSDGSYCWLRYRPCGAAGAGRRYRTLARRQRRLAASGI